MKFGSVCSGIEAASVAWTPLGWQAAWLAEIEKFPCEVLKHHYPDVPNLGDMTKLPDMILSGQVEAPDLFCGGTPCQAFSVAGLRQSLDDARGNLSLTFCEIANAIDQVRSVQQSDPCIVFWENVPGVLNTKDNAFGCFLGALAGEDDALIAPGGRWTNAGFIDGPQRAVAWRVLDAQYFGVAQRRRRVFVVASARDDFDPAAVLFEFDGVRRDTAPSREAGERVAPCVTNGPPFSRTGNERVEAQAMVVGTLQARDYKGITTDDLTKCIVQPQAIAAYAIQGSMIGRNDHAGPQGNGVNIEMCFTQNTIDRHAVAHPMVYDTTNITSPENGSNPQPGDPCFTLAKGQHPPLLTQPIGWSEELTASIDLAGTIQRGGQGGRHEGVMQTNMAVRRLTPIECERLQGFPDGYTNIKDKCPDGPRYKALGNSWAVPVVRWIGERINRALG
jgi:DNA (cytosine-5)-methyltransferase 1